MSASATHWTVQVDPGRGLVSIRGPAPRNKAGGGRSTRLPVGGMLRWRYRAEGPIHPVHELALKCLENPRLSKRLPAGVNCSCPKEWFRHNNEFIRRKLWVLTLPCYPDLALRSEDLVVPRYMLDDLRRAWKGEMPVSEPLYEEEPENGEAEHSAAPEAHGQGQVPGLGQGGLEVPLAPQGA